MLSVARSLCVNTESSNAVQRGAASISRCMQRRAAALMRRYASYVMSSMRTALGGTLHPREREEEGDRVQPADLAEPQSLRAPRVCVHRSPPRLPRNCISRIIGVSLPISTGPALSLSLQNSKSLRETSSESSSGRVKFLWLSRWSRLPCGQLVAGIVPIRPDCAIFPRPSPWERKRSEFSRLSLRPCFDWKSIGKPRAKATPGGRASSPLLPGVSSGEYRETRVHGCFPNVAQVAGNEFIQFRFVIYIGTVD